MLHRQRGHRWIVVPLRRQSHAEHRLEPRDLGILIGVDGENISLMKHCFASAQPKREWRPSSASAAIGKQARRAATVSTSSSANCGRRSIAT